MIVCVCVENPRKSTKNTSRASVVGIVGHYQIPVIDHSQGRIHQEGDE